MAYYFNRTSFSFSANPPGTHVPTAVLFLGMPLVGLLFLMFLPAAGFYLVGKHLLVGTAHGMARLAALLHREA